MGEFIAGLSVSTVLLDAEPYIFSLDAQLLFSVLIQGISIFILFALLSYLLFEPVKKLLANRQEKIKNDIESAKQDKEAAAKLKEEYDTKIKSVEKEAEAILSASRKKALKREEEITEEAKEEADRILNRANQEIAMEQSKVKDDMRKEIIAVATMMASKIVAVSISEEQQNELLDETLKEMGDDTWLSR
ncbi:MAG: F0F1 ATP synthase subunit B [Lachnospiraceae bacterium]|nr:F0F1 ATP synthase subunit B [Lachnospiraceae bacterium]